MRTMAWAFCILLLVANGACNSAGEDRQASVPVDPSAKPAADSRQITGSVRYVDLEGGFYGIVTDDGARLDPVNLPADFQKDGLRIRAYVESLRDRVSIHMWGDLVRITAIERL